jgi:hypothetical protein
MDSIRFITKVEDLTRYDLIYIYHHLQVGNDVELIKVDENPSKYSVFYKGFCLGYVIIPKWIETVSHNFSAFKARVNSVSKSKYLPTDGLDLEITI